MAITKKKSAKKKTSKISKPAKGEISKASPKKKTSIKRSTKKQILSKTGIAS